MKRLLTMALFAIMFSGISHAQFFRLGLKLSYGSQDIGALVSDVQTVPDNTAGFINHCNAGLALRMNFGSHLYFQPEANFSISSVMDSVDSTASMSTITSAFNNIKTVSLSVPVLVGWKLIDVENTIAIRLFAGPEFYTSIDNIQNIDFGNYSILGGVGIDLLDFIYVDARVTKPIQTSSTTSVKDLFYSCSVGILF